MKRLIDFLDRHFEFVALVTIITMVLLWYVISFTPVAHGQLFDDSVIFSGEPQFGSSFPSVDSSLLIVPFVDGSSVTLSPNEPPVYGYTGPRGGASSVIPLNEPPTYIYPGRSGADPTITIAPNGAITYTYPRK